MVLFIFPEGLPSPLVWILGGIGVLIFAAGILKLYHKGIPQQTISALNEATDAGEKVQTAQERRIANLEKEKSEAEHERDGYKSDVERLLREACVRLDIEAQDTATIERLTTDNGSKETTIINLRRELGDVLRQLNEKERGSHGKS